MAIKIIKHGTKVFREICPVCGCEFEYEYEDLIKEYGFVKMVRCPDCSEMIPHREFREPKLPIYPDIDPINPVIKPYVTWTANLDCEKCPNKPDPNHPIVGDTPCTWCKKNQPYCTCNDLSKCKVVGEDGKFNFSTTVSADSIENSVTTFSDYSTENLNSKEK